MKFRIGGITSAGLPKRIPNATEPPNAAEGRANRKAAHKAESRKRGTDPAPNVAEDGVIYRTGTNGPDEIHVKPGDVTDRRI